MKRLFCISYLVVIFCVFVQQNISSDKSLVGQNYLKRLTYFFHERLSNGQQTIKRKPRSSSKEIFNLSYFNNQTFQRKERCNESYKTPRNKSQGDNNLIILNFGISFGIFGILGNSLVITGLYQREMKIHEILIINQSVIDTSV